MRRAIGSKIRLSIVAASILFAVSAFAETAGFARRLSDDISNMIDDVMPSVVVVRTEAVEYYLAQDYYRGDLYRIPRRLAGQGSGVIFRDDGYLLTSYHVVKDADNIEVVLDNEEKYAAEMVGAAPNTDLAVLKIGSDENGDFPSIEIGNSENLRVGEIVVAVGSPFSLQSSVTMGIVSQKGRQVGLLPYEDFIQTDASINPGNSGGPLVNVEGEMVGVNAVIQTPNPRLRGNVGIGFAIPANLAVRVAESIMEDGAFERPWIGIVPESGSEELDEGVTIGRVFRDTPAERAGLRPDDVILKVDNTPIDSIADLQKAVILLKDNQEVELTIKRGEETISVDLTPAPIPRTRTIFEYK